MRPAGFAGSGARRGRWALASVGCLTVVAQVVLLRELAVAFFGVELIYLLALGLWLGAGAVGAFGPRGRPSSGLGGTALLLLCLAAFLPLDVLFLRASRLLFGGTAGAYLPFPRQLAAAALAVVPVGALAGLLFQRAARHWTAGNGTLAGAYAWESAGGLLGGLAATLALRGGVPSLALGLGCALGAAAAAAGLGRRGTRMAGLALAASLAAAMAGHRTLDLRATGWTHPDLLATADTPYGRATVEGRAGQVTVFLDDALAFESQGTGAEALVHPAALHVPDGARVLVLGGALEGLVAEVLRHRPRLVDCVELDPALARVALPLLPAEVRASVSAPGVRLVFGEPRRFLSGAGPYDLILVGLPEPSSGQTNRFYTREFFGLCASALGPSGVLALRLPAAENFRGPQLLRRNAGVYAALAAVFADVVVLPGGTDVYLGSRSRLPRDPELLAARLSARGIRARLVSPSYLRYLYANDRFTEVPRLLAGAGVAPNTDGRPVSYRYGALQWLSQFVPAAGRLDPARWAPGLPFAGLGALAFLLVARLRPAWRRGALAGFAGFAGMLAESAVLLRYQVARGVLYQDVGLLLFCYMAGLAAGAGVFDRLTGGPAGPWRRWGAVPVGGLGLVGLAVGSGGGTELGSAAGLLGLAGFLSASLFGLASRQGGVDQGRAAGPLYGADLLGGCGASLLAGLVVIPAAGPDGAGWALALLALGALLLV